MACARAALAHYNNKTESSFGTAQSNLIHPPLFAYSDELIDHVKAVKKTKQK